MPLFWQTEEFLAMFLSRVIAGAGFRTECSHIAYRQRAALGVKNVLRRKRFNHAARATAPDNENG